MNKEKFFKELGISSDTFWQDAYCVHEEDKKLLLCSKDMLIALIEASLIWIPGDATRIRVEKQKELIEKATGRTWTEIMQIWEECENNA